MTLTASLGRSVPVLVLLAVLAGCATAPTTSDPLTLPLDPSRSPVMLSITTNTGEVAGFTEITVRLVPPAGSAAAAGQSFVLRRQAPEMARDTALFIGALPPGEYEFSSLRDERSRKILELHNGARLLGSFPVEAGKPVDLGRLIVTPMNANVVFGRSARVTSNLGLLQRAAPAYVARFTDTAPSGWGRPRLEADVVEEYALGRPVGASCPTQLASGVVLAASRMGAVIERSKAGRWSVLHAPGIESLLCVAPADLPDAELLVVGEFGTLLRKPPQENRLLPVATGNLPAGNLLRIAGNRKAGWFVALQRGESVTILHTPELHSGAWTPLDTFDVGFNNWHGFTGFWMSGNATGLMYAGSAGPIHHLDYASGAWRKYDNPNKDRLTGMAFGPTGTIGAMTSPGGGFGGVFASLHVSRDLGRSWQAVEVPFKVKVYPIHPAGDGTMYVSSGPMGEFQLYASRDQGKTWTTVGKYEPWRALMALSAEELLDFDGAEQGIFSIRHSGDGGKTWRVEYTNFDPQAYAARNK